NAVERFVAPRDAAAGNNAANGDAVFGHALEDDAGVEGGAFDGGEQFVLRGVGRVAPEGDAAEIGGHQDSPVAIVPGEAQQARVAGAVALEAVRQGANGGARAPGDGVEDVAGGREPRLDTEVVGMHGAVNHAAETGDEIHLAGD